VLELKLMRAMLGMKRFFRESANYSTAIDGLIEVVLENKCLGAVIRLAGLVFTQLYTRSPRSGVQLT